MLCVTDKPSKFSRFTGGSGAPYWTLLACGLNPRNLTVTQAAFLHNEYPNPNKPEPLEYPDMLWTTNYTRLAAATLFTMFFAGEAFTPLCVIDGVNIQHWLQRHYLEACRQLALRIEAAGDLCDSCVIGWDSINEPNPAFVGMEKLDALAPQLKMRKGPMPTPIQSMRLGVGQKQKVEHYVFGPLGPKRKGFVEVDPQGASVWLSRQQDEQQAGSRWGWKRAESWPIGRCVWAAHGVWDDDSEDGSLLKADYFRSLQGQKVNFVEDFWLPHWRNYSAIIRSVHKEAIMFLQPPVFEPPPKSLTEDDLKQRACNSAHFYDGLTLVTKHWNWFNADALGLLRGKYSGVLFAVRVGFPAIRKCLRDQLGYLRKDTEDVMGHYPTLIGELGIPFDLDSKKAYFGDSKGKGKGDYTSQTAALDASLNACDGDNFLNYTLWTYAPDNTHLWGDGWNGEDLSVWSTDDLRENGLSLPLSETTTLNKSSSNVVASGKKDPSDPRHVLDLSDSSATLLSSNNDSNKVSKAEGGDVICYRGNLSALSNGSRSEAAFSRPFASAVVGTPLSMDFDASKSEFKLVIKATDSDIELAMQHGLGTDVFVPFVHYAAQGFVQRGRAAMGSKIEAIESSASSIDGSQSSADDRGDVVAVDVEVSSGAWKLNGQTLTWFLDPLPSAKAGEELEYRLTMTRRGGNLGVHRDPSTWQVFTEQLRSWITA